VNDEVVVIGGQDKRLRSFDKKTGKQQWEFNAGGRIDASPVIVGNSVIVVTMDGMMYNVRLSNGKEIWTYEIGSAMTHNPAVINNSIVVSARDGNVYFFKL
jgi:outer membrane protein assembly factor BamB